nr:transposase [Chromobacterium amazonense]
MSDPAMEESLYEIASMRQFAGLSLDAVPDETTLLNFRHLLEKHQLTHALFTAIHQHPRQRLMLKQGTIVDATLIHAPSSTKNAQASAIRTCIKPRRQSVVLRHEAHIGVDAQSGLVHHVAAPPQCGGCHDGRSVVARRGNRCVWRRRLCWRAQASRTQSRAVRWWIAMRPGQRKALTDSADDRQIQLGEMVKARFGPKWSIRFGSSSSSLAT